MEYDRHILNSNNVMRTSWKLINKELGKDQKNHGFQSLNINGMSTTNHQIIASTFNKHFTTITFTVAPCISMIQSPLVTNKCIKYTYYLILF
jgi:hypothetical protein